MLKILFDMDETIVQFLDELLIRHRNLYSSDITTNDITNWNLPLEFKNIFMAPCFFNELKPFPGAIELIKELSNTNKFEIYIITDAGGELEIISGKYFWLKKYMPFINLHENVIIAKSKYLIKADILIDDNPCVLEKFPNTVITIDRPYNRHIKTGLRVYNNDFKNIKELIYKIYEMKRRVN